MSLVITLAQESITHLSLSLLPGATGGGAGTGLLDWLTTKLSELQSMFRTLSVVGGMGFVIWQAIASRGAMARIIVSGLAAALFVWIVWNITNLQERVDQEVNAATFTPAQLLVSPAGAGTPSKGPGA
jgi:hypothetical protein